jgi:hypothetical protein
MTAVAHAPAGGLQAWDTPDPAEQPVAVIAAGLEVEIIEQRDDGWTKVLCTNGWSAWVDGRRLDTGAATAAPTGPIATGPVQIAGVRITTSLIGGALIVVGSVLPWFSQAGVVSESAFGLPIKVLFDPNIQGTAGFKIGYVSIVLGALTVAAGLGRLPAHVSKFAGGAAAVIATLFLGQLQRAIGQAQVATVFGVLGMGVYLTMVGGVLAAMSRGRPAP